MEVRTLDKERTAELLAEELEERGLERVNGSRPIMPGQYRFGREAGAYVVAWREAEGSGSDRTTEDLRSLLFHELSELQAGRSDPKRARAAAMLADKIIQAARVEAELQVVTHRLGKPPTPIKLIGGRKVIGDGS